MGLKVSPLENLTGKRPRTRYEGAANTSFASQPPKNGHKKEGGLEPSPFSEFYPNPLFGGFISGFLRGFLGLLFVSFRLWTSIQLVEFGLLFRGEQTPNLRIGFGA